MITCYLGKEQGLGNDLFVLAAALTLSKNNNDIFSLKSWNKTIHHNHFGQKVKGVNSYLDIFKERINCDNNLNLSKFTLIDESCYNDCKVKKPRDVCLKGLFQGERYFDKEHINLKFKPNWLIKKYIEQKYSNILEGDTCGIHVRRGDYLTSGGKHTVLDIEYFKKAINIINSEKYIVFSDDIEYCKTQFVGNEFNFIENEKNYTDLFIMSMCENNIISNSSFSWWGAWLNGSYKKKVVAPIIWLSPDLVSLSAEIPQGWFVI